MEGSAKYRKLKKGAQEEYFTQYILPQLDAKQDMNPIARIRQIQELPLAPLEKLPQGPSDDDGWLNVDPAAIEKDMQERYQTPSSANAMDEEVEEEDMVYFFSFQTR